MRIIKRETLESQSSEIILQEGQVVPAWSPRVLTITSGKGGVGKTNLTVNLAIALAQEGQRVIIFDADLGLSNVDVLLGVTPPISLHDHLYRGIPIEDVLFPGPAGVKIVSGGSGFLELAHLNSAQRNRLVKSIARLNDMADYVLVDTGAGINKDVLAFCAAADEVIVVVTPEPTSLTDAYGLIKVIDKFKLKQDVHIAVNQSRGDEETTNVVFSLKTLAAKYLNTRLNYIGEVIYDPAVSKAVKNQKPFVVSSPDCPATKSVRKIAYAILNKNWEDEKTQERGLRGFITKLSKLFK